jgi:hypothetical protein
VFDAAAIADRAMILEPQAANRREPHAGDALEVIMTFMNH